LCMNCVYRVQRGYWDADSSLCVLAGGSGVVGWSVEVCRWRPPLARHLPRGSM
jgi:hypothetical protein